MASHHGRSRVVAPGSAHRPAAGAQRLGRIQRAAAAAAALLTLLLIAPGCGRANENPERTPGGGEAENARASIVESVGLQNPASIVYDAASDVYLVGNTETGPDGRSTGYIARVSPRGRVAKLRWIDGARRGVELQAPKGMAIRGDTLYVADAACIRFFDRVTGAPAGATCPDGATSLDAMTVDRNGLVYVTGTGRRDAQESADADVIYRIDVAGGVTEHARGAELGRPQGIAAGSWGIFLTSATRQHVYQLRPEGPRAVVGGRGKLLAGIVGTPDGSFAFGNATDSTVLYVSAARTGKREGYLWTLARDVASPGHLGFDERRGRVLIPETGRNRLVFVSIR